MRIVRKDAAALIPGPALLSAGFRVSGGRVEINFVYLDEFGHIGPFMGRNAAKYNESPVFGLAGIILPGDAIRPFSTKFLQLKHHVFKKEIEQSGKMASQWERHGSSIFTTKHLARYPHFRSTGFRILNYVRDCGGKVFYYGREKIAGKVDGVNSTGLYTTVLSHAIHQLEKFSSDAKKNFILVVDEHSTRKQLLVTASKTMFGSDPARHMISPPFEVESYINQNMQAADWVAAIVGRLAAYEMRPEEYADHADFKKYFWQRLQQVATHSTILPRGR